MSKLTVKEYIQKEALKESPFFVYKNSSFHQNIAQIFNEKNKIENIGKECILIKSNHINLIL